MIKVKDNQVLLSLLQHEYDIKLSEILFILDGVYPDRVMITEGWREARHSGDVHNTNPCRAVDIRSWNFEHPDLVEKYINRIWIYDPDRPEKQCAIYHDVGSGKHIHIQVHPNTRRRNG